MKILLLGENGLLSSRIKHYFQNLNSFEINSISLRRKSILEKFINDGFSSFVYDYDLIINAIGPNNIECKLSDNEAKLFYSSLPSKLIKFANLKKIRYLQFSSIHSVNYKFKKDLIVSPYDEIPNSPYGIYHNNLEKLFLNRDNKDNYASIIRLSNSIGPPITNNYKKSHWISICNNFAYQLFNNEKIIINDPYLFKSFTPITYILKNLINLTQNSQRNSIYQFVTNYKISLNNLHNIFAKYINASESDKLNFEQNCEKELMEYFIFDNVFSDLSDYDMLEYINEFFAELKYTNLVLKSIL